MLDTEQLRSYQDALDRAVYFDLSAYGKIAVTGLEAATFLHNLSTNDVKSLPVGAGCEAFLCNARARTLAHVLISHWRDDPGTPFLLLDMVPVLREKVVLHLNKYLISEQAEVSDLTEELAFFRLAGPRARNVLEELLGTELLEIPTLHHVVREIPLTNPCRIRRQSLLGLPGFDVFCARAGAAALQERLQAVDVKPAPPEVHEVLRIEAGTPEYGKDMDDDRFVMEVGRTAQAICYTKGCYLGQEPIVMARDRGQVNRTLLGVRFPEIQDPLPPGSKLFEGETEAGLVTSSAWSPRSRQVLALAYLRRGHQQPGTELTGEGRRGVLSALPFAVNSG